MVIAKECLTDYKELYEKANQLVNEESRTDPATEPFRSHYAARVVLCKLRKTLEEQLENAEQQLNEQDKQTLTIVLGFALRDIGRIDVFTEDISNGEKQFNTCLQLIDAYKAQPAGIIAYVGVLNELGILMANREKFAEALDYLKRAEAAYFEFKSSAQIPLCITDVFGTPEEIETGKGSTELESLYTLCAFYLAQVHGHLRELENSAKYCNLMLKRQVSMKTYEHIDFALNAATLSQYYTEQNMYKQARHHLAAATFIMAEHEAAMIKPEMSEQEKADITETFQHRYADVARCWAKYGLSLLKASKDRLYSDDAEKLAADTKRLALNQEDYRFPELQLAAIEDRVTTDYCLTFDDAKLVYHFVISWLDQAKDYYKPETEATEYAKIVKDYAELYEYIAFFEENPINQSKMHKRRAKYLEDLLDLLSPTFFLTICRECWFGAGQAHCAILDIRLDALAESRTTAPQDLQKINQTCQRAIKHFKDFINSYSEKDGTTIKQNLDDDEVRTVLYAYFYMGRLYYKQITADHALQLENMQNSLLCYKKFTDECAAREKAAEPLKAEVGVCREMVNLLPLKISNLEKRLKK